MVNLLAGRAFTISSGNTDVTIGGFKFDGGSPIHDANDTNNPNTSDVTFSKNIVINSNNIYAGASTSWADLVITDNKFEDVNATLTSSAMQVSYTSSTTITDNTFTNVNYAAMVIDATPTINISGNTVDGTGYQGIQLAGAIGNANVVNNKINNANNFAQAADRGAIRLYGSGFTGAVVISNNEITGGYNGITVRDGENITGKNITVSNNSITGLTAGKAIYHGGTGTLQATCNWYGTAIANDVMALISGPVNYSPFLTDGSDAAPLAIGFQPGGSCLGSPIVISSAVASPATCAGFGQIVVNWTDGVSPYSIAWSGPSSGSTPGVSTGYAITGLAPGLYSITITDASASTATTSATVILHPVTNTSTMTTYATIQAAINAASPGNIIDVCAGVYPGTITIDRSLTLRGAKFGVDPRPSVASARVIGGAGESRLTAAHNQKVININADNVTINGFEITQDAGAGAAHTIETNANHIGVTFLNNIVTNTTTSNAMRLYGGQDFLIQKNYFKDIPGEGIVLRNGNLALPVATNQRIIDNDIINQYGTAGGAIVTYGQTDMEISGNIINAKYQGIAIGAGGPAYYFMQDINVHHNEINLEMATTLGQDYGITINGLGDNINIHNNIISDASSNTGTKYALIKVGYDADATAVTNPGNLVINNNFLSRSVNENYLTVGVNITNPIDANCNWWNSTDGATIAARITDPNGLVASGPYLNVGTDNNGSAVGFEPVPGACTGCPGGNIVTNTNTGEVFCTIQDAIDDAQTLNGHAITVGVGTYNEQVIVNKSVSITGVGGQPIVNFTGTPTGKPALFDVSANGVTIDNIHFQVNLATLRSAVIATSPTLDLITIKNNLIDPYGTPAGSYGERNAVSVNYAAYRVATGGVDQINFLNNTVTGANPTFFRAAISSDEASGAFTGNNLTSINQDIQVRFASTGNISITGNTFNLGGVEIGDPNAGAGSIDISNNTFNVANGAAYNNALRLKNNYAARTTTVSGNTFLGHEWGISMENYQNVSINGNSFTPIAASTTYRHITVNTKEFSSASGFYPPAVGATITNNTFFGSGAPGGIGLAFYNGDNDAPVYNSFTLGSAGNENNFDGTIGTYIYLDGQTGPTAAPVTTMAPWAVNLDAQNNTFAGLNPGAMSLTQLFAVEDKIVHKIDNSVLGFVLVKPGHDFVTVNSFSSPATTQASVQRGVDAAASGFTVNVAAGTYNEINVKINKPLTLLGAQANVACGSRGAESIVQDLTNSGLPVFTINSDDVTINGFEIIDPWANSGVDAGSTNPNNLTIKFNNIHDIGSSRGSGNVYAVRYLVGNAVTISNVSITDNCINNVFNSTPSALGNSAGIWFGQSTSTGILNNLTIDRNSITNIYAGLATKAAAGIDVGTAWNNITGKVNNLKIRYNTISGISGGQGYGIQLDGKTPGAEISNNTISNVVSPFNAAFAVGVLVPNTNTGSALPTPILINNNSITGITYAITNGSVNNVDGKCNWYGTVASGAIASKISGDVTYSPYLLDGTDDQPGSVGFQNSATCGVATELYVNDNVQTGDVYTTAIGNDANPGTAAAPFATIQHAINAASNGNTIFVDAGSYAEDIIVNKELTINGSNSSNDACGITRVAEAIVVPATNAIASGEIFHVSASNVTISGFTIDGDNTLLNSTYQGTNGADINAAEGVTIYEDNINNLTVENNIFQNLSYFGVTLYGASTSAPATTGHNISGNKFWHLGTYGPGSGIDNWGGGVLLYNSQYAAITDNCMSNVRIGIQTGNFQRANPGTIASQVISDNTIEARKLGIFHNLFNGTASSYALDNNTITGKYDVNENTNWTGILLSSLYLSGHTVSNNDIDATAIAVPKTGISVWNDLTAPIISGGTITGVEIGINVNNFEGYPSIGSNAGNTAATITGTTITNATIAGIKVHDNPSNSNGATVTATVGNSNTITGSPVGVLVAGSDATATIMGNNFTGNQVDIQVAANTGIVTASPNNNLSGSNFGIENLSSNVVNGTLNYWNDTDDSGPGSVGSGTGVNVSTLVDFCPWLNDFAPTGTPVSAPVGAITVAETGGPVDNDGSICASENVTLEIVGAKAGSAYLWSTGATTASIMVNPGTTTLYSVTVSYGGCSTVLTNTIIVYPVPVVQLVDLDNVLCNGGNTGSIEVIGTVGPAAYSYIWSNGPTTALNPGLPIGIYTVTVTDANLCKASDTYTITQPPVLSVINYAVTNETCQPCNDGTITVNATGGTTAYMYSKDGGTTFQVSNLFSNLIAGVYNMVVKDANGCLTVSEQVIITEVGVYPDLTPANIISSAQFINPSSKNQVIFIRNIGTGATSAPIVFRITKFSSGGMTNTQNLAPSVTILGDIYMLNNNDFDMVSDGLFWKFTSKPTVVIAPGGVLKIGMILSRSGGGKGTQNSSVNIESGTGGGDTSNSNNSLTFIITKL